MRIGSRRRRPPEHVGRPRSRSSSGPRQRAVDYVLARTCALQFWVRAQRDPDAAMRAYVRLCARGGEAPFQELARSAGLTSPFEDGCVAEVVTAARAALVRPLAPT
jgi:hypothetical protein